MIISYQLGAVKVLLQIECLYLVLCVFLSSHHNLSRLLLILGFVASQCCRPKMASKHMALRVANPTLDKAKVWELVRREGKVLVQGFEGTA